MSFAHVWARLNGGWVASEAMADPINDGVDFLPCVSGQLSLAVGDRARPVRSFAFYLTDRIAALA